MGLVDADDVFPSDVLKNFKTYTVKNQYPITNKVVYRKMMWKGLKEREMRTNGQFFNIDEMVNILQDEIDILHKEKVTNSTKIQIKSKMRYMSYMKEYKKDNDGTQEND